MLPEEKHANLVLKRYFQSPPVDVFGLVKKYATLFFRSIPIEGVDGVSLDIKVPGREPVVILNSDMSPKRQRFTLAHELGHIIIPWHVGDVIADRIFDGEYTYQNPFDHMIMEGEANRFAAELLMPEGWIQLEYQKHSTLAELHKELSIKADVSVMAACIKIVHSLQYPVAFCATDIFGIVNGFGQSRLSSVTAPQFGTKLNLDHFDKFGIHSKFIHNATTYHWWLFGEKLQIHSSSEDNRTWREILDQILTGIGEQDKLGMGRSLSGVIGSANSSYTRITDSPNLSGLYEACLSKMDRPQFKELIKHELFELFLKKRVEEILAKKVK